MEYDSPCEEYIQTPGKGITIRDLHLRWRDKGRGFSEKNLKRKCTQESWRKQRQEYWERVLSRKAEREAEVLGETLAEQKAKFIRITEASIMKILEALKENRINFSLSDLERLIRLQLSLQEESKAETKEIRNVIQINIGVVENIVAECIRELLQERLISREAVRHFSEKFAERANSAQYTFEIPGNPAQKYAKEVALITEKASKFLEKEPGRN